jgi:hypothetical protein
MVAQLVGVPSAEIDAVWPLVEQMVAAACRRGRDKDTSDDIRRALKARDLQLWLAWNGAITALAVTQIVTHPRKTCCRIRICIGRERRSWEAHIATIEAWAKAQGCAAMELIARPGWSRLLRRHGSRIVRVRRGPPCGYAGDGEDIGVWLSICLFRM